MITRAQRDRIRAYKLYLQNRTPEDIAEDEREEEEDAKWLESQPPVNPSELIPAEQVFRELGLPLKRKKEPLVVSDGWRGPGLSRKRPK